MQPKALIDKLADSLVQAEADTLNDTLVDVVPRYPSIRCLIQYQRRKQRHSHKLVDVEAKAFPLSGMLTEREGSRNLATQWEMSRHPFRDSNIGGGRKNWRHIA